MKPSTLSILAHLIYFSFFLHHIIVPIYGNITSPPYTPTDNILLDCGSSRNSTAWDDRDWIADMGSKFVPSKQPHNASLSLSAPIQGTSVDRVPYMTARIFRFQFTYTFRVPAGQKFIRLYFYPAPYQGFDSSKAFFSVKAGPYTLLRTFSASLSSLTAEYSGFDAFVKEFILNVGDNQILNITFTPSPSASNDTYAFINGIEIVSMPTNLYYTRSTEIGFHLIGYPNYLLQIDNKTALEKAYRLNVGGRSIPPVKDSGLFRTWSDDKDYWSRPGAVAANTSITINYTMIPAYTAPEEVYQTARSMGPYKTENMGYNLTWALPVDSGFVYLVRLHFCEFQPEITREQDRTFQIFIKNQTVEQYADVIHWSGGNGVAVYRDYLVMMEEKGVKGKRDLFIALHPNGDGITLYSDVILNGLEVFKLSNSDGNLAAPHPELPVTPVQQVGSTAEKSKNKRTSLIAIGGSVVGGLVLTALLCYTIFHFKAESSKTKASSLPKELCRRFSLAEIRAATDNFNDDSVIGFGGFGKVYKGYIDGDQKTVVAIKRLNPESRQGVHEFWTEIEMLSQLRHLHLVSLIGYCNDKPEMILVYDYMTNGTLREHLYDTHNDPLPWKKRLHICIGAARGLDYLHTGAQQTIIHRDVKSTNILLDDKMVAKVSDFGLSKMGPTTMPNAEVATLVKGTWGYLDPEYTRRGLLTEKSDVYSFGVVLLEVLCGRKAVDHRLEEDQVSLAHWAQKCIREETFDQIIDPYLMGQIEPACMREFMEIAERCLLEQGIDRPTMRDVVGSLEFALKMQEDTGAAKEDIMLGGGALGENIIYEESAIRAAIIAAHNNVVSRDRGHVLDSSNSGLSMMGTSTSGLSYPSVDTDSITTSADEFSDNTNPKGQLKSGKI